MYPMYKIKLHDPSARLSSSDRFLSVHKRWIPAFAPRSKEPDLARGRKDDERSPGSSGSLGSSRLSTVDRDRPRAFLSIDISFSPRILVNAVAV